MTKAPWGSYLGAAKARYDEIKQGEGFKLDLAEALTRAREALLRDEPDWPTLVKAAIAHPQNKIINWRNHSKLTEWIDGNVGEALDVLSGMWSEDDRTPGDRIRAFDGGLPESVFSRGAAGTRLNVASYLLMGVAPQRYPPYRRKPFRAAYERLGYPQSSDDADSGGEYEYALDFLDRVLEEARRRGMNWPDTRLEAQSVVWWNPEDAGSSPSRSAPRQLGHALNTILYGPPGTGKTWHTVTRGVAIVENREMARVGTGGPRRGQAPLRRASTRRSDRDGDVSPEHDLPGLRRRHPARAGRASGYRHGVFNPTRKRRRHRV